MNYLKFSVSNQKEETISLSIQRVKEYEAVILSSGMIQPRNSFEIILNLDHKTLSEYIIAKFISTCTHDSYIDMLECLISDAVRSPAIAKVISIHNHSFTCYIYCLMHPCNLLKHVQFVNNVFFCFFFMYIVLL